MVSLWYLSHIKANPSTRTRSLVNKKLDMNENSPNTNANHNIVNPILPTLLFSSSSSSSLHTIHLHRHARMHIKQILRPRHSATAIMMRALRTPLARLRLPMVTKLATMARTMAHHGIRHGCTVEQCRLAQTSTTRMAASLLHHVQHNSAVAVLAQVWLLALEGAGVRRAALANAGLHDEEEDDDGDGNGRVDEDYGCGLA